jgi:hypothetical protein
MPALDPAAAQDFDENGIGHSGLPGRWIIGRRTESAARLSYSRHLSCARNA